VPLHALTTDELERWERDGFLVLRSFVNDEELELVRGRIDALANEDPPRPEVEIDVDPVLRDADLPRARRLRALFHAAHADRALREGYTFRERTLDVVQDLLGPDIVYYTDQTFLKPAGGSGAPPHQDNAYWEPHWAGAGKLSVWLALDPSTHANGCTVFVPGSHRGAFAHETDFDRDAVFGRELSLTDELRTAGVAVELEPGDCCIHHCETVHWSGPNESDHSRRGHVAVYFSSRVRITDQPNTFFRHDFLPARGRTYPGCVGWTEKRERVGTV